MKKILLTSLLVLTTGAASAASMWVNGDTLHYNGATTKYDAQRLINSWDDSITTIVLEGPGGVASQAKMITDFLEDKNVTTVIQEDTQCLSACAMIWLGGKDRIVEEGGEVGLHFAYLPTKNMETIKLENGWNGVRKAINKTSVWSTRFFLDMDIKDHDALFDKMSYTTDMWTLSPSDITNIIGGKYGG